MPASYGVTLIPDEHKRAINVVLALVASEDPRASENCSQPANASGRAADAVTHWYGGRPYADEALGMYASLKDNISGLGWPNTGVTQAQATAACLAMSFTLSTDAKYTTMQAQRTVTSALAARGLQRVVEFSE
jgi:hypothetical protein